jgi:AraC-like DNA-binding protein
MSYREYRPPPELVAWLDCLWERSGDDGPPVRVLPDGCIDIVWTAGAGTQVVGPNTTAFLVSVAPRTRVVGARMRPGGAPALLGLRAELVRDIRSPVRDTLGDDGRRLESELDRAQSPGPVLAAWLTRRAQQATQPDPLVTMAVHRLDHRSDDVTGLACDLGLSARAFRRRVTAAVGYGPKRLGRVLRLGRALEAARAGEDLSRVAFDAGYCDQAHFSGECRELAGVPPSQLLAA